MRTPIQFSTSEIRGARGPKNVVNEREPYAYLVEDELSASGRIEPVATLFLTNRECPFTCLFCDLWKNTTDETVPEGAIVDQIDFALARLPLARHIKLYNSGNFFDSKAIPPGDLAAIAERVQRFRTVIVENHPRFCTHTMLEFRDQLRGQLEVAMGLETIHPEVLPALNKRMTVEDFDHAAEMLAIGGVALRAFVLLKPPFLEEEEAVEWALKTMEHAFDQGARVCSVIPVRGGNGVMDLLARRKEFAPPMLASLEKVAEAGIAMGRGRVFVDLWDAEKFATCPVCAPARISRLSQMNLTQEILPKIACACGEGIA
jgi:radical SAM enzyme (TIGR01210 family)